MKKKPVKHSTKRHPSNPPVSKESVISFESLEFPHHSKNELWYIGIVLLVVVGLITTLRLGDYLLSAVVVAAGLAVFRIAGLRPGSRAINLSARGLGWGSQFFGFHQLKAFWVSEHNGQLTVYLERPNLAPVLHFAVPDERVETVLTVLSLELPFHPHRGEPASDRFNRLLRI